MDSLELATIIGQDALASRSLTVVAASESQMIERAVGAQLGVDYASQWWWQQARSRLALVSSNERDLRVSLSLMETKDGERVYLFACDDEPPPWPCVAGSLDDIAALVGEARYFEFMLVDASFRWVAFETHHNELLVWPQRLTGTR